ncbi:MAG TPA: NDP-sugar synthase [Nitrospiraceae bacterium]|nr:NDP-sugar synthase [Nitrospiraceae bacterium]
MILAAGFGARLRPLTNTIPKPLLPIAGTPLIVWNLLLLRRHGITDAVMNLHHLGHLIEKELGDGSQYGMHLSYSHEAVILGTGGGIKHALDYFHGEPFFVLNGDTLVDINLSLLLAFHRERTALATMVVREDPEADRWGAVELDKDQRVLRINGRGLIVNAPSARAKRMFAGIHIMHPRLLRSLPPGHEASIIDAYVREIERGERICGFTMDGYWSDIGTPERYAQAQKDAESGLIHLAERRA